MTGPRREFAHIALIVQSEVTDRLIERLGVVWMRAQGFKVSIFDVADVIFPYLGARDRSTYDSFTDVEIVVIRTAIEQATLAVRLAQMDVIFCYAGNGTVTRQSLAVFRAVCRTKKPYLLARTESSPIPDAEPVSRSIWHKVRQSLRRGNWIDNLLARTPIRFFGLRPADVLLVGGLRSIGRLRLVGKKTRIAPSHCFDYEFIRDRPVCIADNIAVFIDQNLPFHRDWRQITDTQVIDPDNYFSGLRRLFDLVERETGLRVVIALHPLSEYEDGARLFGGRELIKDRTHDLLLRCKLAIASTSLAVTTAILRDRGVLIVTTRDFYASWPGRHFLDPLAAAVGSPLVFLEDDTPLDFGKILDPDRALFRKFIDNYVRHPDAPDESMWQTALTTLSDISK